MDEHQRDVLRGDIDDLAKLAEAIRETADAAGLKRTAQLISTAAILLDAASLAIASLD